MFISDTSHEAQTKIQLNESVMIGIHGNGGGASGRGTDDGLTGGKGVNEGGSSTERLKEGDVSGCVGNEYMDAQRWSCSCMRMNEQSERVSREKGPRCFTVHVSHI